MPSKKKRYNARFPPARIKKIMQLDDDVGKVAAAVPVIISRVLELFIESLITKSGEMTLSRNARTLTTSHIKQTILSEKKFDFLKELVESIPDVSPNDEEGESGEPGASVIPEPLNTLIKGNSSEGKPKTSRLSSTEVKVKPEASVAGKGTKPRGRPRKIRPEEIVKESKAADEVKEPKKRGRKKKIVALAVLPVQHSDTDSTDEADEEMDEESAVSEDDGTIPSASENQPTDLTNAAVGSRCDGSNSMFRETKKELRVNNNNDTPLVSDMGVTGSMPRVDQTSIRQTTESVTMKRPHEDDSHASSGMPLDLKVFRPTYKNADDRFIVPHYSAPKEQGLSHGSRDRESQPSHDLGQFPYNPPSASSHKQHQPWISGDSASNKNTLSSSGHSTGSREDYFTARLVSLKEEQPRYYGVTSSSAGQHIDTSSYSRCINKPFEPSHDDQLVNGGVMSSLERQFGGNGQQYGMSNVELNACRARSKPMEMNGTHFERMSNVGNVRNDEMLSRNCAPRSINTRMMPPLTTNKDLKRSHLEYLPESIQPMASGAQGSDQQSVRSGLSSVQAEDGLTPIVQATVRPAAVDTSSFVRSTPSSGTSFATHRMPHIPTAFHSNQFARSLSSPQPTVYGNSPLRQATYEASQNSSSARTNVNRGTSADEVSDS